MIDRLQKIVNRPFKIINRPYNITDGCFKTIRKHVYEILRCSD